MMISKKENPEDKGISSDESTNESDMIKNIDNLLDLGKIPLSSHTLSRPQRYPKQINTPHGGRRIIPLSISVTASMTGII